MSFLEPLLFLFMGLLPVVILLYLLKLRRTPVMISSTILWFKSLQDLTANAPFQRLRKNLLLFLQLLIIALLVIAAARPFIRSKGTGGSNLCLLIDRSASMQTKEAGTTRIEIAKQKAIAMVEQMAGGDKVMVVTFDSTSNVLCELTDDQHKLRTVITSIQPVDTETRLRDAVLVASSLQSNSPELPSAVTELRTIIISDGAIADIAEIGARAFDVSYLQIGETPENAGITAFSIRDPLEGQGDERQCLILVRNEGAAPLNSTITLSLDNTQVAVEEVSVEPKSSQEVLFALNKEQTGVLKAELDTADALDVDNVAHLVLKPAARIRTLLVGEAESSGSFFLKRVFALDPRVDLSSVTPTSYTTDAQFDLTIFDGFSPATLPSGQVLFVNALPPGSGISETGVIESPSIVSIDSEHPLMRFLNPSNVTVSKARQLVLPAEGRELVSTQGAALVADVSRGGQQIVVIAFDLGDSNWPLRLSFPLFFQNLVSWVPRSSIESQMSVQAGDTLPILPREGAETATVTLPNGERETVKLDATRPVYFGNTFKTGVYEISIGESKELHAVNLTSTLESSITPAAELQIGRSQVAGQRESVEQNRELWKWFVVAALGVLALEWWIYSRRAWL